MPIFRSKQPPIDLPTDITIWDWLFEPSLSPSSPWNRYNEPELAGYTDAASREHVSWPQVKQCSTYISTALVKEYGFGAGQTLSLFSRNTIWYPVMMFAGIRVGAMCSGASPAYSVDEMTYALKTAKARFLATSPTSMEVALEAAEAAGIDRKHIFLLEGQMDGFTTIQDLIRIGRSYGDGQGAQEPSFKVPSGKKNFDCCAFLSFSSGTTGLPKAVMIAHQNVIAQSLQMQQITTPDQKKVLAVLPMFHITGLVHLMNLPILINAEVIMLPAFSMPAMLDSVCEYKIQEMLLVPPIFIRLVRDPVVAKYDLRCVKRFSSGAAPLSPEILQLLQERFPWTQFKQGYGMTETCSCITATVPEMYDYKYAPTVGTICASTEVKIIRDDGAEAAVGEPGEIWARGPQVVMGYLDNAKATAETFGRDGFLHTGDLGVIDGDGVVTILDRIKELIKVKGIGVAPAELEDLLLGHEQVEDVAILGVMDDYSGELPMAYVVPKPGVGHTEELARRLMEYVRSKKVRHKWVRYVRFVDDIPKSASGKILRRVLRRQSKDDLAWGGSGVFEDTSTGKGRPAARDSKL